MRVSRIEAALPLLCIGGAVIMLVAMFLSI
jgi:hypothetical protein